MILNYFKNLFANTKWYRQLFSIDNLLILQNNSDQLFAKEVIIYQDNLIGKNNTGSGQYDFSEEDYKAFHNQFLNNNFFLNEKNKPVLEKIHEDLTFVYDIFNVFKDQQIGLELILTGGSIRDFILGKSESIKDLDITVNITSNYSHFMMYNSCKNISSVVEILLKEKNIQYDKLCELSKNFERPGMYNNINHLLEEVIEIKGKHFPIQLLCTTNSNTLINNFDFDISKIGLRVFSNHSSFKEVTFPENIEQYISRLEYGAAFISHVIGKKLSYHNGGKTNQQIVSELTNHFPRVALKYPDFAYDIFSPNDENYTFTKELFDKSQIFNKLSHKLESHKTEHKIKTRKI